MFHSACWGLSPVPHTTQRVGAPCWALQRQLSAAEAASRKESKEENQNCTEALWVQDVGFLFFHPSPDWEQGAHGIKGLIPISSGFSDSEIQALCLSLICTHVCYVNMFCAQLWGLHVFQAGHPFAAELALTPWGLELEFCTAARPPGNLSSPS